MEWSAPLPQVCAARIGAGALRAGDVTFDPPQVTEPHHRADAEDQREQRQVGGENLARLPQYSRLLVSIES